MVSQEIRKQIESMDKEALEKAEREAMDAAEALEPGTPEYADALELLDLINEAILPFEGPREDGEDA